MPEFQINHHMASPKLANSSSSLVELAAKEWRGAVGLLTASVQRYLDACTTLEKVCSNALHLFDNATQTPHVLDDVDEELAHLTSHLSKLGQAQTAMSLTRNRSPKLVPVNLLPREILSHIFELVVIANLWGFHPVWDTDDEDSDSDPELELELEPPHHPSRLSEVCKYWHQVVTGTPVLWSYIDLVVSEPHRIFYTRASQFVERAVGVPLLVRIHDDLSPTPHDIERLVDWLAPVCSRIYSLDIALNPVSDQVIDAVLNCWFTHGASVSIKELGIWRGSHGPDQFITSDSNSESGSWRYSITPQHLADFFQSVTVLRLNGLFFHWGAPAYRELEHSSLEDGCSITEAQLVNILSNSPRLYTLTFGLAMTEMTPRGVPFTPVSLPNLGILNLRMMGSRELWSITRLIAPGTRPLRMALWFDPDFSLHDFDNDKEMQAFFRRSNVTTFYLCGAGSIDGDVWLPMMIRSLPHLRMLYLDDCRYLGDGVSGSNGLDISGVCLQLRVLCAKHSRFNLDGFELLLRARDIQVLRLWGCTFISNGKVVELGRKDFEQRLSKYVPNVVCYVSDDESVDSYMNWNYIFF
ncbi:hypothetical protein FRC10_010783 [Ceratobasidium sp. 414]|nr:hypothetical protein FRC10_010783 [Ceratobasidium sp. 414]